MRHGRFFLLLVLLALGLFRPGFTASADGPIEFHDVEAFYTFGETITFQAQVENDQPVVKAEVFYRPVDGPSTWVGLAEIDGNLIKFVHEVEQVSGIIPVFSTVEYRFRTTLQDGQTDLSDIYYFTYTDNRFEWQTLQDPPFRAFWVEGDLSFGQEILDSARSGLKRIKTLMDFPDLQAMDIYAYPTSLELQIALQLSGLSVVAGSAHPEIGVVMVSLPPGPTQRLEIQRQVPHEIMHVMLYQKYGDRYENIPTWLSEGLSSMAEANPDPDYFILLQDAVYTDSLLPIDSLCSGFRLEASLFYLSYAQSESFTRYLYENFGSSGMVELLDRYADGVECSRAPQLVYGQSLARLEDRWYRDLVGETNWWVSLEPLVPWVLLLGIVLFVPTVLVVRGLRRPPRALVPPGTVKGI